jgi:predicted thioredoxin/glutaredoxin
MRRQARDFPAARTVSTTIASTTEHTHMVLSTELRPTISIAPNVTLKKNTLKKSEKKKIAQSVREREREIRLKIEKRLRDRKRLVSGIVFGPVRVNPRVWSG